MYPKLMLSTTLKNVILIFPSYFAWQMRCIFFVVKLRSEAGLHDFIIRLLVCLIN